MGGRLFLRVALAVAGLGLLSPGAFAREAKGSPVTEMEAALEAANRANVRLPADLQLKYVWSLPLKGHIVDQKYVWIIGDYVVVVSRDRLLHLIRKRDGVAVWAIELENMPMYKPVITDKAVYVVVNNYIVCIDVGEGRVVWRIEPKFAISTAPVVKHPDIYVGSWDKKLHALEVRSREKVWYRGEDETDTLKGTFYYLFPSWHLTTHGHLVGDPQEFSGFIYFSSEDRHLYSISLDGDLRYKAPTQGPIKASPAVKEDRALVGSTDFSLYCFNRLTGSETWHFPTGADVLTQPYVDKRSRVVYCPSHKNGVFGVDERIGKELWHIEDAEEILAVSKEVVYLGLRRNRMLAVQKKTGIAMWISLLRGVRYYVRNYNDWSSLAKPDPAKVFLMLKGNVLCCMEELARETAPVKKRRKAKKPKAD